MLDTETLLRSSDPSLKGVFVLIKCGLVIEGVNTSGELNRCDNITYAGLPITDGTEYTSHQHSFYNKTDVSDFKIEVLAINKYAYAVCVYPDFMIVYIEMNTWHDSEADPTPSTMWGAKSIFQLIKNMREWSFLTEEPFNSDHPMARYSKLFFDTLNPPQEILDEIDALPDMHLAKFLKGQENYKSVPHPYPEVSQDFKDWVLQLSIDYPEKPFEEMLDEI